MCLSLSTPPHPSILLCLKTNKKISLGEGKKKKKEEEPLSILIELSVNYLSLYNNLYNYLALSASQCHWAIPFVQCSFSSQINSFVNYSPYLLSLIY